MIYVAEPLGKQPGMYWVSVEVGEGKSKDSHRNRKGAMDICTGRRVVEIQEYRRLDSAT